jgi:hypothetical protein
MKHKPQSPRRAARLVATYLPPSPYSGSEVLNLLRPEGGGGSRRNVFDRGDAPLPGATLWP